MADDVGRPSLLDDEQFLLKIKDLYLDGKNEKEIAEILEIPLNTWNYWKWKNYQSFSDKLLSYKHERLIQKAEANVEVLMESEDERIQADMSKFILETVGKRNYSKRIESTGADGKDLPTPIIQLQNVQSDNSNQEDSETE